MNRRALLKSLAGLATAPLVAIGAEPRPDNIFINCTQESGSPIGSYWAFAGEELRKGDVVYWVDRNTVSKYPK